MRRSIKFCEWKAEWWKERGKLREVECPVLGEGLLAYSHQQSDIELARAEKWRTKWADIRERAVKVRSTLLDEIDVHLPELVIELEDVDEQQEDDFSDEE